MIDFVMNLDGFQIACLLVWSILSAMVVGYNSAKSKLSVNWFIAITSTVIAFGLVFLTLPITLGLMLGKIIAKESD